MTLPPSITRAVVEAAGKELAQAVRAEVADTHLLTLAQAADLLGVSKPSVRNLIGEWVDLGPQSPRVELRKVKALIESRRVPT